jgi:hypothetical protein
MTTPRGHPKILNAMINKTIMQPSIPTVNMLEKKLINTIIRSDVAASVKP